jgi:hypothetical protein
MDVKEREKSSGENHQCSFKGGLHLRNWVMAQ